MDLSNSPEAGPKEWSKDAPPTDDPSGLCTVMSPHPSSSPSAFSSGYGESGPSGPARESGPSPRWVAEEQAGKDAGTDLHVNRSSRDVRRLGFRV